MNYRERVGKNINHYRKVNDLTLKEVANRVGITEATMQKYEVGQIKRVDIEMIDKIATAIGTTASKLTGWLNHDEQEEAHLARIEAHKANADSINGLTKNEVNLIKDLRKSKAKYPTLKITGIEFDPKLEELISFFNTLSDEQKDEAIEFLRLFEGAKPEARSSLVNLLKTLGS